MNIMEENVIKFKRFTFIIICILLLSGCSLPGLGGASKDTVKITALATSESQIMAHMIRLQIEHDTDGQVKPVIVNNLGSAVIEHNAILNGNAQISATRYTGTDLVGALDSEPITNTKKAEKAVKSGFQNKFDQTFFDSYGFENTFAFTVTKETAEKYNLKKVSDLEKHKDELKVASDATWIKRKGDGYPAFTKAYGFEFKNIRTMQIGLVYDALKNKSIDAALGYTTDGRIAAYDLVTLEDDRQFFPPYDASPLATNAYLKDNPKTKKSIQKLIGKVSTEKMQELNFKADGKKEEPAVIAEKFLKSHNYFE